MSAEKNSPVPFKDVPEGSMFWHDGGDGYTQALKLVQDDEDVRKSGMNAVIVVCNPSPGYMHEGWLTTYNDETEVFLEKPEEWVQMEWGSVPAGALFKLSELGDLLVKASDDVPAFTKAGEAVNALLVSGPCIGWFKRISRASVFVLKDTLAGKQEGEEA